MSALRRSTCAFGTERNGREARRGAALISSLIVFTGVAGMIYATTVVSAIELRDSRHAIDDVRSKHLAESGLELGLHYLNDITKKSGSHDPLSGFETLFANTDTLNPFVGHAVMSGPSRSGAVSVSLRLAEILPDGGYRIEVTSTGYLPDAPANLAPGQRVTSWSAVSATVDYGLEPSAVFDNGYFINNWGWFYGNTIECNGNARSNGQFDAAGYSPLIGGQPVYESVAWDGVSATLSGYQDDNGDGLSDGGDGGVYSGWDIVGGQNLRGIGGNSSNQHDFQDQVPMPNLSDLTAYEDEAKSQGGNITLGGVTMTDAVFGDAAGETGNLYLHGTAADPIHLDGPVVVQGDVIISGYVTGQGAIYAGGNVYVPDSVQYLDPPGTPRPTDNTQAASEQWLSDNWDKDFLGLFATENVVVGDHTHWLWRHYVSGWMASSLNGSAEDAGEDGIPNTHAGRDGIVGTADDDVLEGDGVFTAEYYSDADAALGLIPPGFAVGDVIPGTGEDIDGDGQYDPATTLADVDLKHALSPTEWGGNMPSAGFASYSDIATLYAANLDATFYTNHSFCYVVFGSDAARVNGSIVSRNENIVYGTPSIEVNYDNRLLGGNSGLAGSWLPKVLAKPVLSRWTQLSEDPNRYQVNP